MRPLRTLLPAVVLSTSVVACGGGDDAANLDAFVGAWQIAGTQNTRCGMNPGSSGPLAAMTITFTEGVGAPLVVVQGNCTLQMDVKGNVATLRPGQSCPIMNNNATVTAMFNSGSFTAMGITGAFQQNATFSLPIGTGGLELSCTYDATGTATKVPK